MFDRTMDVVVKSALDSGILTVAELEPVARDGSLAVDWRTVSAALPDRANTLKRFAAGIYGFQPVVVSQVGTLVLADRLVGILPRDVWKKCFALDCIPVLPHGVSMSAAGHVTLASPDPARAAVRNLARSILSGRSILAYADQSTIDELKSFLPARLPAVSQAVQAMDADHSDSRSNAA